MALLGITDMLIACSVAMTFATRSALASTGLSQVLLQEAARLITIHGLDGQHGVSEELWVVACIRDDLLRLSEAFWFLSLSPSTQDAQSTTSTRRPETWRTLNPQPLGPRLCDPAELLEKA